MSKTVLRTAGLAASFVLAAAASPVVYTFTLPNATGTLNGTPFSHATVTLQFQSDTASITNPSSGVFQTPTGIAGTFSIAGGASGTITTTNYRIYANQNANATGCLLASAGIGSANPGDYLDSCNAAFATYSLQSPFGPVTATYANVNDNGPLPTSAGPLAITGTNSPVFTAAPGTLPPGTPAPPSLWLALAGCIAILAYALLARRRTYA